MTSLIYNVMTDLSCLYACLVNRLWLHIKSGTTTARTSNQNFFIGRSVATLTNNSCNIRIQCLQHQKKNMYTRNSDIRFGDGDSHRNIDTMFRATSTTKHKETIITTLVLVSCNMCQASDRSIDIGRLICSITISKELLTTRIYCWSSDYI